MRIREINRIGDLAGLRADWWGLLHATPRASFFQSLEWLEAYLRHFGRGQRLRVLAAESGGSLVGVLPLVVRRETTKVGPLRYLTFPLDHWGSFYGPVGPAPVDVLVAGLAHLRETGLRGDVLEFRWVGGHEDECDGVEAALAASGYEPQVSDFEPTAVIDLAGGWDAYLTSRKSKWRNNLRRCERRVAELGEVAYERFRPEAGDGVNPRWDLYEDCLQIAASSWQAASRTGTTLTHATVAAFLRDVHAVAARSGCIDLNLLRVDGRPVAFAYNYVFRGNVFGLRAGYDPAVRDAGAGNLLYARAIEDSFRRGDWRYDLGPGSLECKRALLTDVMPVSRVTCCRRWSPRQQLLRLKRQWDGRAAAPPKDSAERVEDAVAPA